LTNHGFSIPLRGFGSHRLKVLGRVPRHFFRAIGRPMRAYTSISRRYRARYSVNGRKRSLRAISAELAAQDHVTKDGKRYAATVVARMIAA
jgi:hypothetical protein